MKLYSVLLALCLALSAALPASADPVANPSETKILVKTKLVGEKTLQITLANLQREKTTIRLENLEGAVFYQEFVKNHNGFNKKIDLRKAPAGRYVLKVEQKGELLTQVVVVREDSLAISRVK